MLLLWLVALVGYRVGEAKNPGPGTIGAQLTGISTLDSPDGLWPEDEDEGDLPPLCETDEEPWMVQDTVEASSDDECCQSIDRGAMGTPVWFGDVGLPDEHIQAWRTAEAALRLGSQPSTSKAGFAKAKPKAKAAKRTLDTTAKEFVPAQAFSGAVPDFVFKTGPVGLGYYKDDGDATGRKVTILCLDEAVPPPGALAQQLCSAADAGNCMPPPGCFPTAPRKVKRARRARHPDGGRKQFPTREIKAKRLGPFLGGIGMSTLMADDCWKARGLFAVDTANANSWDTLLDCVLARSSADVVAAQESKIITEDRLAGATLAARAAGWNPTLSMAHKTAAARGSGGVGIFARKGQAVEDLTAKLVPAGFEHRIGVAWVGAVCKGGLHVLSLWPKDSEGMSEGNMTLLEAVGGILSCINGPWICAGDWNFSPSILQDSNWPKMVRGSIVATSLATCHFSTYDYFVVHNSIRHLVAGVQRISDGGFNPHYASRLLIKGDGRRYMVRQLQRPGKVAGCLPFGPPNRPPGYDEVFSCKDIDKLEDATVAWLTDARREFQDLTGTKLEFKRPTFVWKPACGAAAKGWAGASKKSILWRTLGKTAGDLSNALKAGVASLPKHRIDLMVHQLGSCSTATSSLPKMARAEVQPMVDAWAISLTEAVRNASGPWTDSLQKIANAKAVAIEAQVIKAKKESWLVASGAKPAVAGRAAVPTKVAYRWTKGVVGWKPPEKGDAKMNEQVLTEGADQDDGLGGNLFDDVLESEIRQPLADSSIIYNSPVPLADQAAVQREADQWAALWNVTDDYDESMVDQLEDEPLELLGSWAIAAAASTFPADTGLGADNIAPRALCRLSDRGLSALAHLFAMFERAGRWTAVLNLVLICLLPKTDGGLRPIGLFPTPIRVWMRSRVLLARMWEAQNALPQVFGGKGMGAQRASWEAAFIAEMAARQNLEHIAALLDLVKAFEMIPHKQLIQAGLRLGYPMKLLKLSLAAYRLLRAVGVDGIFAELVQATRGITAGSGFATSELRLLLIEMVWELRHRWGDDLNIKLYVDDLTLAVTGKVGHCMGVLDGALQQATEFLQGRLGMEVSIKKSVVVAGRAALAKAFCKRRTVTVVKPVARTKLLGVDFTAGRRRSTKVAKARLKSFGKRVKRFQALRRSGLKVAAMARAAATPAICYGADVMGIADSTLETARSRVCGAASPPARGRSVDITLWMLDGASGTLDPGFDAVVPGLRHWCYAWWEAWFKPAILTSAFDCTVAAINFQKEVAWNKVAGPMAALLLSLKRVGWAVPSAEEAIDHQGHRWSFRLDSPAIILQASKRAVRNWRLQKIGLLLPGLIPEGLDCKRTNGCEGSFLLDFADVLKTLCKAKGPTKAAPLWDPKHRGDLLSAVSGGQWTQSRKFAVRPWQLTDNRCQLCGEEVGTISHRFACRKTAPTGGWPAAPQDTSCCISRLNARRRTLLQERGLLVLKLPRPVQRQSEFQWLWRGTENFPDDVTWYIDGSMFHRDITEWRATGYSVVVHSRSQGLLAFGGGVPPPWCTSAAAAEAWALLMAIHLSVVMPRVITDCKGLVDTVCAGLTAATAPSRVLARIWVAINAELDGKLHYLVTALSWMPAHQTAAMIGNPVRGTGRILTVVHWRANRLADAVAKAFARDNLACDELVSLVASSRKSVAFHASLLATVTHCANNCPEPATRKDGTAYVKLSRDSVDPPAFKKVAVGEGSKDTLPSSATAVAKGSEDEQPARSEFAEGVQLARSELECGVSTTSPVVQQELELLPVVRVLRPTPPVPVQLAAKRRRLHEFAKDRKADAKQQLASRVAEISGNLTSRPTSADGESRLEAFRRRVRGRFD